jgi:Polyketide cyclase / dehydrase and lipid transport
MDSLTFSDSILIHRSPEEVYDMIADVTRMGEWSPECRSCAWEDGAVAAERGQQLAWVIDVSTVRWTYAFEPAEGGTLVTESWEFPPSAFDKLHELFGDKADERIAYRTETAHKGIPVTLGALKKSAESAQ